VTGRARSSYLLLAVTAACICLLALAGSASALQPLQRVGSTGAGAGKIDGPDGVAIGEDGSLYVADEGNNRIDKFAPSGSFLLAWGKDVRPGGGTGFETCTTATGCKAGIAAGGAGALNAPSGIAIDAAGNLHVSEFLGFRLSEFKPSGAFIRARGFNVIPGAPSGFETCTTATGCKGGVSGGAAGQLANPEGLTFDTAGNLWEASSANDRIDEFGPSGAFVKAFGWDVVPGGTPGPEVCTSAPPGCQGTIGGPEAGQFASPRDLELRAGKVYVTDEQNSRISVWTTAGAFVLSWGGDVRPGPPAGFQTCTIATTCQEGTFAGGAGEAAFPAAVAFDSAGRLNVSEFENNRISQFTTAPAFVRAFGFDVIPGGAAGFELCSPSSGCKTGTEGTGFGQLSSPDGIVVDCRNAIWVGDDNDRVTRFGEAGTPSPPCTSPPPPPEPSNDFSFGKVKKNKKKGRAKLAVEVPGPGDVDLAKTKKVKGASVHADAAGEVSLPIKPKGKAKKKLKKKGKAKVKAEVTFTPDGGEPNTQSKRVGLKKKKRR
jgi:tripartite motif-containing protein 71